MINQSFFVIIMYTASESISEFYRLLENHWVISFKKEGGDIYRDKDTRRVERGTFFGLEVYTRIGTHEMKYRKGLGKLSQMHPTAVSSKYFKGFLK